MSLGCRRKPGVPEGNPLMRRDNMQTQKQKGIQHYELGKHEHTKYTFQNEQILLKQPANRTCRLLRLSQCLLVTDSNGAGATATPAKMLQSNNAGSRLGFGLTWPLLSHSDSVTVMIK